MLHLAARLRRLRERASPRRWRPRRCRGTRFSPTSFPEDQSQNWPGPSLLCGKNPRKKRRTWRTHFSGKIQLRGKKKRQNPKTPFTSNIFTFYSISVSIFSNIDLLEKNKLTYNVQVNDSKRFVEVFWQ